MRGRVKWRDTPAGQTGTCIRGSLIPGKWRHSINFVSLIKCVRFIRFFYIFGEIENFKSSTDGGVTDDLETDTDILYPSRPNKLGCPGRQSVIARSMVRIFSSGLWLVKIHWKYIPWWASKIVYQLHEDVQAKHKVYFEIFHMADCINLSFVIYRFLLLLFSRSKSGHVIIRGGYAEKAAWTVQSGIPGPLTILSPWIISTES